MEELCHVLIPPCDECKKHQIYDFHVWRYFLFMMVEQHGFDHPGHIPPLLTSPQNSSERDAVTITSQGAAPPELRAKLEANHLQAMIELRLWMRNQHKGVLALYFDEPQLFVGMR